MRPRSMLLGVLLWLAVVSATCSLTWLVISSAREGVLGQEQRLGPAASDTRPAAEASRRRPRPSDDRRRSPRVERDRPALLRTPPPPSPAAPGPSAGPGRPDTGASSPARRRPVPSRVKGRTWQGASGSVAVHCADGRTRLRSASPNDGYRVELVRLDRDAVEVRFTAWGDPGDQVSVRAACSEDGARIFMVDGGR